MKKRLMNTIPMYMGIIFSLLSCTSRDEKNGQSAKPNILFILVDDLGWKDLGVYGSEFYDTPNIDELARQGTRFTDAYAASPVCSPTRAAILTGKHPARVNITDWIPGMAPEKANDPRLIPPEDIHDLPLAEVTIAEAFKEQGYKTFFAGKWHLGETPAYWPEHQGFDINKGGHQKGSPPGGYYSPYKNPRLKDGPEGEYLTDRLTDESLQFMKNMARKGQPFFLYLSFYTVHTPIQGAVEFDSLYQQKKMSLPHQGAEQTRPEHLGQTRLNQSNYKYAAMVRSMDKNVGRLMDQLAALNLSENTIVVLTSDNGGLTTKENAGPTAVVPLRGGKGWLYEGGIRVPLIISAPGMPRRKVSRQPVTSMDYYPTLLELAGLPPKQDQHVDGKSIVPYLEDPGQVDERTLVWHYPHYHGSTWRPGSAIRQGNWKLVEFFEDQRLELYNLDKDLEEQHNLAGRKTDKTKELHQKLIQRRKSTGAKLPRQKDDFSVR